jgi:hypothetical protein
MKQAKATRVNENRRAVDMYKHEGRSGGLGVSLCGALSLCCY